MSKKQKTKTMATVRTLPSVMPTFHAGAESQNFPDEPHAKRLMSMFTYKRPYLGGEGVGYKLFIDTFIMPVALAAGAKPHTDAVGNVFVDLRSDDTHRTMFTAHTDSVHYEDGRQHVAYDPQTGLISVLDGDCLGADDAAGVALMLHMIENGVPGMYVFPAGEEVGGVGARHIAQDVEFLSQFDRAIAFDRRGDYSIITHQMGGRCCSDDFALALAEALDTDELMFSPDQTGSYTDTAEFIDVVPECTNVSIGYMSEHTSLETLDLKYFQRLADQIVKVDFDALPVVRDPAVVEDDRMYWMYETTEAALDVDVVWFEEDLMVALEAAMDGDTEPLILLLADAVSYDVGVPYDTALESIDEYCLTLQEVYRIEDEMISGRHVLDVLTDAYYRVSRPTYH